MAPGGMGQFMRDHPRHLIGAVRGQQQPGENRDISTRQTVGIDQFALHHHQLRIESFDREMRAEGIKDPSHCRIDHLVGTDDLIAQHRLVCGFPEALIERDGNQWDQQSDRHNDTKK